MVAKRRKQTQPAATEAADSPRVKKRTRRLKSQAWFWTPKWQAKEREADEDIAAGQVQRFSSAEELFAALGQMTKK